jgi:hypothetical protein
MVNPACPLGRVTGRSAAKLHEAIQIIPGAVQPQPVGQNPKGLGLHLLQLGKIYRLADAGRIKPLRIWKTRDYHRFLYRGNKSSARLHPSHLIALAFRGFKHALNWLPKSVKIAQLAIFCLPLSIFLIL